MRVNFCAVGFKTGQANTNSRVIRWSVSNVGTVLTGCHVWWVVLFGLKLGSHIAWGFSVTGVNVSIEEHRHSNDTAHHRQTKTNWTWAASQLSGTDDVLFLSLSKVVFDTHDGRISDWVLNMCQERMYVGL